MARVVRETRRAAGTSRSSTVRRSSPRWRPAPWPPLPRRVLVSPAVPSPGTSVSDVTTSAYAGVTGGERVPGTEDRFHPRVRRTARQPSPDGAVEPQRGGQEGVAGPFGEGRPGGAPPQPRHLRRCHPGGIEGGVGGLPRQGESVLVRVAHGHGAAPCARSPRRADIGGRQAKRRRSRAHPEDRRPASQDGAHGDGAHSDGAFLSGVMELWPSGGRHGVVAIGRGSSGGVIGRGHRAGSSGGVMGGVIGRGLPPRALGHPPAQQRGADEVALDLHRAGPDAQAPDVAVGALDRVLAGCSRSRRGAGWPRRTRAWRRGWQPILAMADSERRRRAVRVRPLHRRRCSRKRAPSSSVAMSAIFHCRPWRSASSLVATLRSRM